MGTCCSRVRPAQPERLFGCEARGEPCPLAFKVVRLDPANLEIVPLITVDEAEAAELEFGGATGALGVRNAIWVGSFTGERIAIFCQPPLKSSFSRHVPDGARG